MVQDYSWVFAIEEEDDSDESPSFTWVRTGEQLFYMDGFFAQNKLSEFSIGGKAYEWNALTTIKNGQIHFECGVYDQNFLAQGFVLKLNEVDTEMHIGRFTCQKQRGFGIRSSLFTQTLRVKLHEEGLFDLKTSDLKLGSLVNRNHFSRFRDWSNRATGGFLWQENYYESLPDANYKLMYFTSYDSPTDPRTERFHFLTTIDDVSYCTKGHEVMKQCLICGDLSKASADTQK